MPRPLEPARLRDQAPYNRGSCTPRGFGTVTAESHAADNACGMRLKATCDPEIHEAIRSSIAASSLSSRAACRASGAKEWNPEKSSTQHEGSLRKLTRRKRSLSGMAPL